MAKTFVIGDIHGCLASLQQLMRCISPDPVTDTLIFLGDYVDRGPNSAQVLDLLLDLRRRHQRMVPLLGNHEQVFLDALQGINRDFFLQIGGRETLASYGIDPDDPAPFVDRIPQEHIDFLHRLHLYWEDEHAIYVHAGLQPGRHLSQQQPGWCLWVRDKFVGSTCSFGKPVVFGHTAFPEPLLQEDKVGIDTGAVYGGQLSCLILPDRQLVQVPGEQKHPYRCII